MKALLHKILYRTLPLEGYLRAVSRPARARFIGGR